MAEDNGVPIVDGISADMLTIVRLVAGEKGWDVMIDAPANGNVGHWAKGDRELVVAFTRYGMIDWSYVDRYDNVDVAYKYWHGKLPDPIGRKAVQASVPPGRKMYDTLRLMVE